MSAPHRRPREGLTLRLRESLEEALSEIKKPGGISFDLYQARVRRKMPRARPALLTTKTDDSYAEPPTVNGNKQLIFLECQRESNYVTDTVSRLVDWLVLE